MVKKRIILILLLISLVFQTAVYAMNIVEDNNTAIEEGSETTENIIEKEPEDNTEESKPEEPSTNNTTTITTPEATTRPSYESQTTNSKVKSENANLNSLVLEGTDLAPEFKPSITEYTAIVGLDVENIKVEAK